MTVKFPTSKSFFVSQAGRRLQDRIKKFFSQENIKNQPSVLIGSAAPFYRHLICTVRN